MKFQVLLSTMNRNEQNIKKLMKKMNIKKDCLIINQVKKNSGHKVVELEENITMINSTERGLSKSRNLALKSSNAEICLLSDDDLEYIDDFENLIIKEFERNKDIDILIFEVDGKNKEFKKYKHKERNLNYITSMKVASVQIAFRRKSIIMNSLRFNELLGAGAKYSMGEENEFLFRCLEKGLKIRFIPSKIADLYIGESSWFNGYNEKYFIDRGASFAAMSEKFAILLIVQFAIRKYKLYKYNEVSIKKALKYMILGKFKYLNEESWRSNEVIDSRRL